AVVAVRPVDESELLPPALAGDRCGGVPRPRLPLFLDGRRGLFGELDEGGQLGGAAGAVAVAGQGGALEADGLTVFLEGVFADGEEAGAGEPAEEALEVL